MITDSLLAPILRQQTAVLRSLKKILPTTMPMDKMSIYIQSNNVYVSVQNAMVAQQWVFIKKTVLSKLQEQQQKIKDIKIQIEPTPPPVITQKNNQPCQQCGSNLLRKGEKFCALCQSSSDDAQRQRVFQFLKEAPWLRYEDLDKKDKKLIDYEAFMRERTFQINRIYDKIGMEYWSWHRKKDSINLNQFKTSIEEYVITKLNIHPQHLIMEQIKSNVPKRWYKLYEQQNH